MHSSGRLGSPPQPESLKTSLRRRLAGWAGVEDRPPVAQESWWWPDESRTRHHHHHSSSSGRADSSDTASISSLGRCDSESTQGDSSDHPRAQSGTRRSRKRDWFKVLLAARNLATFVYALSFTTSLPVLPFMSNRLIYPRASEGLDDPGSEGVREAWQGMAYGLVMSGYYFTKMMSAPWIGFLSDRVGRRQALVFTLLGGAFSFFVTKVWGQYSIQGLIVCRLLMGCFAANGALMHAYIRDTVPQEWQSSAFSQHSASWGCAYLAAPALIAWAGDSADAILTLAASTMIMSAIIVEITFVDTRPEGSRTQRMSRVVSEYLIEGAKEYLTEGAKEYLIEGARDLAEVGKKVSGLDLADYFNGGREKELVPRPPSGTGAGGGVGGVDDLANSLGDEQSGSAGSDGLRRRNVHREEAPGVVGVNGGGAATAPAGAAAAGGTNGCSSSDGAVSAFDPPPKGEGTGGEGGGGEMAKLGSASASSRALVRVFQGMMKERLVLLTFVLQAIRPAQDLAPLVALKFSGGASVIAGITSSRSLCRALVPMTPLIPWLVRLAGGSSSEGAAARMGGDRAVAAFMCVLMAGLVACIPSVGTLRELHHLMAFKGLCYIVRESTAGAVMARSAGTASVGAFFGWQHCIKGIQGTISNFLTGWLSGYSIALPYYMVAICDLLCAFTYLFF